ncbi:MAG: hypothetical protein BWY19_01007 [bacterium ADurb.Bin212]|nr:MAG: hypothetical protein BWY19_01007 [bacterium ADurb.Bin212]
MQNTNKTISLRVHAGSSKNSLEKRADFYELWVTSRAYDNQANLKVIEIMSKCLDVPKSQIKIIKGLKSSQKIIQILI